MNDRYNEEKVFMQKEIERAIAKQDVIYTEINYMGIEGMSAATMEAVSKDMQNLIDYVNLRLKKISQYSNSYFRVQGINRLMEKLEKEVEKEGLSQFDQRIVLDLIDYVYDFNPYEEPIPQVNNKNVKRKVRKKEQN